jgi:hypothetical protein
MLAAQRAGTSHEQNGIHNFACLRPFTATAVIARHPRNLLQDYLPSKLTRLVLFLKLLSQFLHEDSPLNGE